MNIPNQKLLRTFITKLETYNPSYNTLTGVASTQVFVDKTLFIKEFLETQEVALIAAPPGFGKTTNMDTLKQFLLGNANPFKFYNMDIYLEDNGEFFKRHCKKHPVLHLDFETLDCTTYQTYICSMYAMISSVFLEHQDDLIREIGDNYHWAHPAVERYSNCPTLGYTVFTVPRMQEFLEKHHMLNAFRIFTMVLGVHWRQQTIVLIDNFDAPIKQIITNENEKEAETIMTDFTEMMRRLFSDNDGVVRGLINTSFCPEMDGWMEMDTPVIKRYPFLNHHKYSRYYGFTKEEVSELLERTEFAWLKRSFDKVRKWYGGYEVPGWLTSLYNPRSLLAFLGKSVELRKPVFLSHWINPSSEYTLRELFATGGLREKIEELLNGCELEVPMKESMSTNDILTIKSLLELNRDSFNNGGLDVFMQYLTNFGYFSAKHVSPGRAVLKIPNLEIKHELKNKCMDVATFQRKFQLEREKIENYGKALLNVAEHRNSDAFNELKKTVKELFAAPAIPPSNDDELCHILYSLAICESFYAVKLEEGTSHKLDFMVIHENTGILVNVGLDSESAKDVHSRIFDFEDEFFKSITKNEIEDKVYIGLHLDGERNVTLHCSVNQVDGEDV